MLREIIRSNSGRSVVLLLLQPEHPKFRVNLTFHGRRNLRGLHSGGTSFNRCSTSMQNSLNQARSSALSAATNTQSQIN